MTEKKWTQEIYKGFTITYSNSAERRNGKQVADRHHEQLKKLKGELELLTMPDGPWNWQEEGNVIYPDGPGHPRGAHSSRYDRTKRGLRFFKSSKRKKARKLSRNC